MLALLLTAVVVQSSSHAATITGVDGACRGPGGADYKVESKYKGSMTLQQCQAECNANSASCKGYAYSAVDSGGTCIIYGPGFAGSCSDTNADSPDACAALGQCSDSSKTSQETCGECSGDAETKSTCEDVISETWTPGTWTSTAGTWTGPADGWLFEYHPTTIVTGISPASGYKCYDLDAEDHHPKCNGGATCTAAFANLAKDAKVSDTCTSAGNDCTYVTEIKKVKGAVVDHPAVTKVSGWDYYSGVCRSGTADNMLKPDNRDSKTNGANDGPATNEECMQSCVDAGDACQGYSHSTGWCILYGDGMCTVTADMDNDGYTKPGWKGYCQNHEDHTISQRKPNAAYICVVKNAYYGKVATTAKPVDPLESSTDRRGIMVALFSLWLTCFF